MPELVNDFYIKAYISFDDWKFIPKEKFEWIEEWHAEGRTQIFIASFILIFSMKNNTGGKKIILRSYLSPEPIIEDVEIRKLKKKSLELAGVKE